MTPETRCTPVLAAAMAAVLALTLTACDKADDRSAGQKLDGAMRRVEQKGDELKARAEVGAEKAKVEAREAARTVKEAGADAAQTVREAGTDAAKAVREVGADATQTVKDAGAKAAQRAGGAVADAVIVTSVKAGLARDPRLSALAIDVDATAGRVLLRGTAPDADARLRATALATATQGVSAVDNQLVVQSPK